MDNIQKIFARNLRENRRKCGLTQAQLAEKAEVSTHYIALIELARNIPKVQTIERLAKALNVEIYDLFIVPLSPAMEMKKLNEAIIADLKNIVKQSVDEAFEQERKKQKKPKTAPGAKSRLTVPNSSHKGAEITKHTKKD